MIDSHAHLDHLEDPQRALREASAAGVTTVLAMSVNAGSCLRTRAIADEAEGIEVLPAFGLHPGEIRPDHIEGDLGEVARHLDAAAAVGEIGLDFWVKGVRKDPEARRRQEEVFRRQLRWARERDLPAVIHSRGAWGACLDIVLDEGVERAVFHWYSGPTDVLERILRYGYYISVTPALAYSPPLREAARRSPPDRVLAETDCPVFYRHAVGEGGFGARPVDVRRTHEAYAVLTGMDPAGAARTLDDNARRFFRLPE